MSLKALGVAGTLAPPPSKIYYQQLLDTAGEHIEDVYFETIFLLGLGEIIDATDHLAERYFENCNDDYVLIGHSQGGLIVSLLAMRYPERVKAVIAIATPFHGTNWTDPINMPVRGLLEGVKLVTRGKLQPKLAVRRFVIPVLPIVGNLAVHSDISDTLVRYLATQQSGPITYAMIGTKDWAVFPHRSANPRGPFVKNYIVTSDERYQQLLPILPKGIEQIAALTGHTGIICNATVLAKISEIIKETVVSAAA